jgi:DNA-binding transcriptional MerR regulator
MTLLQSQVEVPRTPVEYTIDELAAHTGVPSRTIRFYQARGVLPPPRRRGRIAVYDATHAERLRTVTALQGKGLRLQAIREVVSDADRDAEAVRKWFGVDADPMARPEELGALLSETELKRLLGRPSGGAIRRLLRRGALERQGEGETLRYCVLNPALFVLARRLGAAGVDIETAIRLQEILERRFARVARAAVGSALSKLRKRVGREPKSGGAALALARLLGEGGFGEEAVRLIFTHELQRAVEAALAGEAGAPDREGDGARSG